MFGVSMRINFAILCYVALVVAVDTNGYERLINQMYMHDNVLSAPESELAACGRRFDGSRLQQATSFSLVYAFIISSMPFMAPHISSGISSHRTAEPPNRGHQNQRLL